MECEQVLDQGTVVSWGKAGEPEQTGWLVSSAPEHPGHTGKLSSSENPQFIHQEHADLGTGQNIGVVPTPFFHCCLCGPVRPSSSVLGPPLHSHGLLPK